MATNTTNFKFKKPDESDFYDIQDQNGNWDLADAELQKLNTPTFEDYTSGSAAVPSAATALSALKSKIKLPTFMSNVVAFCKGCCTLAMIVNNCVSSDADKPLAAAQGKALMDRITQLNSDLGNLNKLEITSSKAASFISGVDSDGGQARFFLSPAGKISSQVFNSNKIQTAWYNFLTETSQSVTYGGILPEVVDFSSPELFGSAGSIKIWQTGRISTPTYAPEYHDYGILICIHSTNYYKQIMRSGSINGAEYIKFAMALEGLKAANWYKYTGTVANKS